MQLAGHDQCRRRQVVNLSLSKIVNNVEDGDDSLSSHEHFLCVQQYHGQ